MIAELMVFVTAMLVLLALVGGALWRSSRAREDRLGAADEQGERRALEDPR